MFGIRALLFVVAALSVLIVGVGHGAVAADSSAVSTPETIKKRGALKIGWAVWYPYAYLDPASKKLTGFSVELGNAMGEALEVKTEWVEDSWATLIAGLQAGKYDITIPMGITLKRAVAVSFSKPFIQFAEGLAVPKSEVGKYQSWKDLDKEGFKITTTMGSTSDIFLKKALNNAELVLVKDGPTSINQVLTGRAQAWAYTYDGFKKVLQERNDLAIVPGPPYGHVPVAFVVRPNDTHLREWINYFLDEEQRTGALARILKSHGLDESYLVD